MDEKGQALMALLTERLSSLQAQISASLDEVVAVVPKERALEVLYDLKSDEGLDFDYLRCLSVVDYKTHFEVVYHLWSTRKRHKAVLKTTTSYEDPRVPSITELYRGANWFEREGHDFFGVVFEGHPDLKPLLLYEGFEGYPGRKSYPFYEYEEW